MQVPFVSEKVPLAKLGSLDRAAWKKKLPVKGGAMLKLCEQAPKPVSRHVKMTARSGPSESG